MRDPQLTGVWLATTEADYVFYESQTPPIHQRHILLHELGHLWLGHQTLVVTEASVQTIRERLGSCPSPGSQPRRVSLRLTDPFEPTAEEAQAEAFATSVAHRLIEWTPSGIHRAVNWDLDHGPRSRDTTTQSPGLPAPPRQHAVNSTRTEASVEGVWRVWRVEREVAYWTETAPARMSQRDILTSPALSLYRCVISILDNCRLLLVSNPRPARALVRQLTSACRPDIDDAQLMGCLQRLGQRWRGGSTAPIPCVSD